MQDVRVKILWHGDQRPRLAYTGDHLPGILKPGGPLWRYVEQGMHEARGSMAHTYPFEHSDCEMPLKGVLHVWYAAERDK